MRLGSIFFESEFGHDEFTVVVEFGISVPIHVDHDRGECGEELSFDAQFPPMPDCSSDESAEDVALAHIGGFHSSLVTEDEYTGANMVGDDPDRDVLLLVLTIDCIAEFLDFSDQWYEDFGFIDAFLALEHRYGPFDSHSGVDALAFHGEVITFQGFTVAHEDVVPGLHSGPQAFRPVSMNISESGPHGPASPAGPHQLSFLGR
jgi:hypothetical protein